MTPRRLSVTEVNEAAHALLRKLQLLAHMTNRGTLDHPLRLHPIPRGGTHAVSVLLFLTDTSLTLAIEPNLDLAHVVVDDLVDSGATRARVEDATALPFATLFTKRAHDEEDGHTFYGQVLPSHEWVVFPWEHDEAGSAADIPTRLLQYIGEDPTRAGLVETPARFLKAWRAKTAGYGTDVGKLFKSFAPEVGTVRGMVLVRDVEIESSCEHHCERIWGFAHIAYIPNGRVLGLSKFHRIANAFARRLQVQERLTANIADAFMEHLEPQGVGVVIEARHACMEVRGVERRGSVTVTSELRGCFYDDATTRAEFLSLARTSRTF